MSLPLHCAVACYMRRGNETLFTDYRNYPHHLHEGKVAITGGHIENESPDEANIRETKEETGIKIKKQRLRGIVLFSNDKRTFHGKPAKYNFKVYFYESYDFDDSQMRAKEGELIWVVNEKAIELEMHEGDRHVWEWMQKHEYFEGEIIHEGEKVVSAKLSVTK